MIDNFSILLSHALLLIAFWRLLRRDDLDFEAPPATEPEPEGFARHISPKRTRTPPGGPIEGASDDA